MKKMGLKYGNKPKEGKIETFMGWMQSDEGMEVRKSVKEKNKNMKPDKSGIYV